MNKNNDKEWLGEQQTTREEGHPHVGSGLGGGGSGTAIVLRLNTMDGFMVDMYCHGDTLEMIDCLDLLIYTQY